MKFLSLHVQYATNHFNGRIFHNSQVFSSDNKEASPFEHFSHMALANLEKIRFRLECFSFRFTYDLIIPVFKLNQLELNDMKLGNLALMKFGRLAMNRFVERIRWFLVTIGFCRDLYGWVNLISIYGFYRCMRYEACVKRIWHSYPLSFWAECV